MGQLWRPLSVHNPSFPAPTLMLPRDAPASNGAAIRAECSQGPPALVRPPPPLTTSEIHTSLPVLCLLLDRTPAAHVDGGGEGRQGPPQLHKAAQNGSHLASSARRKMLLFRWTDAAHPVPTPSAPPEWPSGRSSLRPRGSTPSPRALCLFRARVCPLPQGPELSLPQIPPPLLHVPLSPLNALCPSRALSHAQFSLCLASQLPPLPRGAPGHPETLTPSCSASQSSRRAAGETDAVRLWAVTGVAWGSSLLTDAQGRHAGGRGWGISHRGQGLSLWSRSMKTLSQGRLQLVLGQGRVSPGGAVSGLGK